MIECLRRELLYSEKRARDLLFDAVRHVLDERGSTLILSRLTREAVAHARQTAMAVGYRFENWETTSKAVVNAMLGAGVLLTPRGSAIPDGIAAQAETVAAVRDGFEDLTEAYLLEFLIRRMGNISIRDHTALAHALFRQFDRGVPIEDLEDRVVILLARLEGRVELDRDRYVVADSARRAARSGP